MNRMIASSFVWTKHRNVTDGQTDRQNRSGYYSGRHHEQCRAMRTRCKNTTHTVGARVLHDD